MTRQSDRAINSIKFIAAGRETSRFAFDSYFGRRYLGYLGRIIRLVSRTITISMAQITQKIFQSEIFKIYVLYCCLLYVKIKINFLKLIRVFYIL